MRLFRQRSRADWSDVIDRVKEALETVSASSHVEPEKAIQAGAPRGRTASVIAARQQSIATADCALHGLFVVGETRYGMMQYLPDDLPIGRCLHLYGEYLQHALEALERFLRPGMVIFESASGIGAHSVPMAGIIGATGHLILDEEEALSRRVLQHNLRIAGARNVTVLPPALRPQAVDDLGLHRLDLFKMNRVRNRGTLKQATRTLETLRPAVFLESSDRSNLMDLPSRLQALDYDVQVLTVPYFDANNFRGLRADAFEDQGTFVMLAIPRERDPG